MATTAGGLPYVEPSDLVSGWPAVSQSLAETLDTQLAAKAALAGATYTGTHNFTGATVTGVPSGLNLITSQSFTTASAVNVNNCFSSTYASYRIIYSVTAISATTVDLYMRLRVSGADNTTSSYQSQRLLSSSTTVSGDLNVGGTTQFNAGAGSSAAGDATTGAIDIHRPNQAGSTIYTGQISLVSTNLYAGVISGRFNNTTVFDGFSLYPASGNMTGSLFVYGYKTS